MRSVRINKKNNQKVDMVNQKNLLNGLINKVPGRQIIIKLGETLWVRKLNPDSLQNFLVKKNQAAAVLLR